MKASIRFLAALVILSSCNKAADAILDKATSQQTGRFISYTIKQGSHYCEENQFKMVDYGELGFTVKFDSSAIYTISNPRNQYDINKLYGFSDNNTEHHQNSARFGWRWSDNALRLFAYVYNNSVVQSREIKEVEIGEEINCTIRVSGEEYIFIAGETVTSMPRYSTTAGAKGYQLYPYFGGDETAPHDITILIKQ